LRANSDLQLLTDAAKAAAEIALRHFRDDPDVWDKGDNQGPVTEADLEIDAMLRRDLLAARPGYGWLSEETEDDPERLDRARTFIVDPIDGTRAFIAGERTWSHSLAIAERGKIVAAAVHVPMLNRLYTASDDDISRLNGDSIKATHKPELEGARVLAAKPNFDQENWISGTPPLERHFRPSLAYRLSLVGHGRFDAMLTLRDCWEWDIAAGELIVRQAGGIASDRAGAALVFNQPRPKTPGCLAAGKALHPLIAARLRQR
jgi:myo-inositol-1(or 4)-monophosphatase